ncbi:MAG: SsrA-binding protein SmpB [Bacteroidetes bacterium]|nr:SsrA-binding protein SmpB [Bacteroidota bacterium]
MANAINIKNKKAYFQYSITEVFTTGIVLTGTEIKSIRSGKVNLSDSYCLFIKKELWVRSLHISEYEYGTYMNHEPKRDRKLLLTRRELRKLETKTKEKGYTIIPLRLYLAENGWAKLEIGLARGKKLYDKREDIKKRDVDRDMDRRDA